VGSFLYLLAEAIVEKEGCGVKLRLVETFDISWLPILENG